LASLWAPITPPHLKGFAHICTLTRLPKLLVAPSAGGGPPPAAHGMLRCRLGTGPCPYRGRPRCKASPPTPALQCLSVRRACETAATTACSRPRLQPATLKTVGWTGCLFFLLLLCYTVLCYAMPCLLLDCSDIPLSSATPRLVAPPFPLFSIIMMQSRSLP